MIIYFKAIISVEHSNFDFMHFLELAVDVSHNPVFLFDNELRDFQKRAMYE